MIRQFCHGSPSTGIYIYIYTHFTHAHAYAKTNRRKYNYHSRDSGAFPVHNLTVIKFRLQPSYSACLKSQFSFPTPVQPGFKWSLLAYKTWQPKLSKSEKSRNGNAENQIFSMSTITWSSHRQVSLLSTLKLQTVSLSEESISYHSKKMHFSSPTLKISHCNNRKIIASIST